MSGFQTVLNLQLLPDQLENKFMLTTPLHYWSDSWQRMIVAPAGFITDLLSFAPLSNKAAAESVIHDLLCSSADVALEQANRIYEEALKAKGYNVLLVSSIFDGVGIGAKSHLENKYSMNDDGATLTFTPVPTP